MPMCIRLTSSFWATPGDYDSLERPGVELTARSIVIRPNVSFRIKTSAVSVTAVCGR